MGLKIVGITKNTVISIIRPLMATNMNLAITRALIMSQFVGKH